MSTEIPTTQQAPEAPPPPAPAGSPSQQEKTWGMLCHILAFSGVVFWFFGNILGPLIMWLVKKNESAFVADQGKESVNFQITATIAGIAVFIVNMVLGLIPVLGSVLGILLSAALGIGVLILVIMGAMKANEGVEYRYPYNLRLIK